MKKHIVMSFDIDSETAEVTNVIADQIIGTDHMGNKYSVRIIGSLQRNSINNLCEELGKVLIFDVLDPTEY